MTTSLIVAVSSNGVIGRGGGLPWHLARDLKRFKELTMGHHLVIGRRTWDEVGRPLPGRTMVIVTRDRGFSAANVLVAHSLEDALDMACGDDEPFIGGGAEIYRMAFEQRLVDRLYLTRVHARVDGDTFFPDFDREEWHKVSEEHHGADEKNDHPVSFLVYEKRPKR